MMLSIDFLMTDNRQVHGGVTRVASVVPLMRHAFLLLSLFTILQLTLPVTAGDSLGNPYKILGVSKHATLQDIRKAYKHLVKEWHPDKTDHPMAEDKFVEITKAYELLTDPERRRKFDNHGITEEGMSRQRRDDSHFNVLDPLEELFTGNFKFHYQSRDITLFHKMSITHRSFENMIVPKTYRMPYLILFYSDWCYMCLQAEPTWRRLIDELEPLGLGLATAHAKKEPTLARRLGIHSLPCLVIIVDGRTTIYKESTFSIQKVVEFVRSRLPSKLISIINNNNVESFLSGWTDNRIRALIFEKRDFIRLRYLLMSFYYRDRIAFGFVQFGISETENITSKYKISGELDTLLLFNENSEKPMASVSMKDISSETMHNVIANNKFLILPRLSNQAMLDSICPPEWLRPQKRLCAVLISQQNSPLHDMARHKFRQAALESSYSTERVRYAYVFKDTQPEFVSALSAGENSPLEPLLHIVIIWRRDANHLKYEWLSHGWVEAVQNDRIWNETRRHLEKTIQRLLRTTEALSYAAVVRELADEHAQGTVDKLIGRALLAVDYISDNLTKEQVLSLISVLVTLMFIGVAGYGMSYLVKLEEVSVQSERAQYKDNGKSLSSQPQLRLHELRVEKYYGLVRLLKPGCRTIVLLVDTQSRLKLLPAFHKAVWPYRKNKTLMFAHMSLERGLDWYKKLLSLVLPDETELNINAKNCVGTVLSLNGHRKYFCMYHAKHPECTKNRGSKRMEKMTKQLAQKQHDPETGAFIGFDESDQDEGENMLYQDLLDGLPMWLDRLFEGLTQRYYINYWPEFTANRCVYNPTKYMSWTHFRPQRHVIETKCLVIIMQCENLENDTKLYRYAIAIQDMLEFGCTLTAAALAYKLNADYLSMFYHTIVSQGKVIKGRDKNLSFFDELAFLLYVKICPQGHCVCIECFKEYFPRLIYKFVKKNNLICPQFWDVRRKADANTKRNFLSRNKYIISKLFSNDCLRLSPNDLLKNSLYLDDDVHECPQDFYAHDHGILEHPDEQVAFSLRNF